MQKGYEESLKRLYEVFYDYEKQAKMGQLNADLLIPLSMEKILFEIEK